MGIHFALDAEHPAIDYLSVCPASSHSSHFNHEYFDAFFSAARQMQSSLRSD
jgi:hypothetical protein